jgi:DNA-binding NarL/FixJ family response regulator
MSSPQPSIVFRGPALKGRRRLTKPAASAEAGAAERKLRVCVKAENRLLRDALVRLLAKPGDIDVLAQEPSPGPAALASGHPDVYLLASRGNLAEDLVLIRQLRASAPHVRILLIGMARNEGEFLQCVRAGISGYLLRDASSEEVLAGVRAVHAGEAVCPGALCALFFRYFAQEAALPLASRGKRPRLSPREQQLLPLIGQGLSNKEVATRLDISEQTVKNHLQRLKKKLGVPDRSGLMQLYRTQVSLTSQSRGESPPQ